MKVKELEKIARQLLPELPGFAVKRDLLFIHPIGHTLRAICFDRSIDPRGLYAQMFVQPLFMPEQKHVVFNFGWRLDRERLWNADAPGLIAEIGSTIRREAVPFLSRIQSPRDVAEAAISLGCSGNLSIQRTIAFAFAREGDVQRSAREFDELVRLITVADPPYFRKDEMTAQAEMMKKKLLESPADFQRQLETWESETAKNLGLEDSR